MRDLTRYGLACLALALIAFLAADTGAIPDERTAWACTDWWCAPKNTLPVGLALLFGGAGLIMLCIAIVGRPDEPDPPAPPRPRRSRGPH